MPYQFTEQLIQSIAETCGEPTGDEDLDLLYANYNEASPREDIPVYYRFLYRLAQLVPDLTMVELGMYRGAASLHFLKGGGLRSTGIDLGPKHEPSYFNGLSFDAIKANSTAETALNAIAYQPDILFIDTDHEYDRTKKEFELWRDRVRPGGLILFDDICAPEFGCTRFWNELEGRKLTLPELHPDGWGFGVYFA